MLTPHDKQLVAMATALTTLGWPSMLFNSGGNCMVVAIYDASKAATMETSHGQYEYCAMAGNADGPWGMEIIAPDGDCVASYNDINQKNVAKDIASRLDAHFKKMP
jgi:hypothetical protein